MDIRCPSCEAAFSTDLDRCPKCGAESLWKASASLKGDDEPTCQFCHRPRPLQRRYLRVRRRVYIGSTPYWEWINLSCECCLGCAWRASWLGFWSSVTIAIFCWFAIPIGIMAVVFVVGDRAYWGENLFWLILATFGFGIMLSVAVGVFRGRWIRRFLGNRLDESIRAFVGISSWGIYGAFWIRSWIPEGESSMNLNLWAQSAGLVPPKW